MITILPESTPTIEANPPYRGLGKITDLRARFQTQNLVLPDEDNWIEDSDPNLEFDDTDTTTQELSCAGERRLRGVTKALTIGREYLVGWVADNAANAVFPVRVIAQDDDTGHYMLSQELPVDVPNGARVLGNTVSYSGLTADDTKSIGAGFALWEVTIAGKAHVFQTALLVSVVDEWATLNFESLLRHVPRLKSLAPSADPFFADAIAGAALEFREDLEDNTIDLLRIRTPKRLEGAHAQLVFTRFCETSERFEEAFAIRQRAKYQARLDKVLGGRRWWYDDEDDRAPPEDSQAREPGRETITEHLR